MSTDKGKKKKKKQQQQQAEEISRSIIEPQPSDRVDDVDRGRDDNGARTTENDTVERIDGDNDNNLNDEHKAENVIYASIQHINELPPLPIPKYEIKRKESLNGIALVFCVVVIFVGLTHGVALEAVLPPSPPLSSDDEDLAYTTFLALLYGEIGLALFCLLGMLIVDPGTVKRNNDNCFPIPDEIKEWLESVEAVKTPSFSMVRSNVDATKQSQVQEQIFSLAPPPSELYITSNNGDGRVYCTRCLVWRPPNIKSFHCMTCQRCVSYFDHHCTVFGRCIAGLDRQNVLGRTLFAPTGNYRFFVGIIVMGVLGYLTTASALLYTFSIRYGPEWAIPIGVVILFWMHTSIVNSGRSVGFCLLCRRWFVQFTDFAYRSCYKRTLSRSRR